MTELDLGCVFQSDSSFWPFVHPVFIHFIMFVCQILLLSNIVAQFVEEKDICKIKKVFFCQQKADQSGIFEIRTSLTQAIASRKAIGGFNENVFVFLLSLDKLTFHDVHTMSKIINKQIEKSTMRLMLSSTLDAGQR